MRKIVTLGIVALFLFFNTAFGECLNWYSCFYVGAQGGFADTHYNRAWLLKKTGFTSVESVESRDYAARMFLGYTFNQFYSLEAGYLFLQNITFKKINGSSDGNIDQIIADFVVKATLPMRYFGLFLKAGGAYVRRNELKIGTARYRANNKYVPVLGAGFSLYMTKNITASAEYDRYIRSGDFKRTDYYGAGLAYEFS